MKTKQKTPKTGSTPAAPVVTATPTTSAISWFTQATIILALISFVGYLLSLSYELAFCRYFHILYYLISLNPTIVLSTIAGTTMPFIPLLLFGFFIIIIAPTLLIAYISKNKRRIFGVGIIFILFYIIKLIMNQDTYKDNIFIIKISVAVFSMLSTIIIWIIFKIGKDDSWWSEPPQSVNTKEELKTSNQYTQKISFIVFIILLFIALGFYVWSYLGKFAAENLEEFFVVSQPQELVIIHNYGDYLYGVPFSRDTKKFESQVVILKMSEVEKKPLTLALEKVGPLQPAQAKQSSQATDQFAQELPLRGTAEESSNQAYDILKAMGGTGSGERGQGFFMGLPDARIVVIGYRKHNPQSLTMGYTAEAPPPAAQRLCKEVERRYLALN